MKLIDLVRDQQVHFQYCRENELWYKTTNGFLFPVPISDIGNATFMRNDKAILFMRYIRKYKNEIDHIPNKETLKSMEDSENGIGLTTYDSFEEMKEDSKNW